MLKLKISSWIIQGMSILLFTACNRDGYQELTSLPEEIKPICLGNNCTQSQSAENAINSAIPITTITPCMRNWQLYAQNPAGLPGTLVYMLVQDRDILHLIGGYPLVQHNLEIDDLSFYPIGFSPNGEWLAYRTGSPYEGIAQTIHLLSSTGEVVQTTPTLLVPIEAGTFNGAWGSMLWVNDEIMLLYIDQSDPEYPDTSPHVIKALLNPFTGEWQQSYLAELERQPTGTVAFAPDMTRVLFFSEAEGRLPEIRLWDMVEQRTLWHREDNLDTLFTWSKNWTGSAAWSPDSAWVAFTAVESQQDDNRGVGVYLLDRDGKTGKIITDFYTRYGRNFDTSALSWSPNGRYLAMGVRIASSNPDVLENRFYLYDLKNDELIALCWFRGSSPGGWATTHALVWSPDSRYLAYVANPSVSEDNQNLPRALILVDIYTGEVIELVENATTLGGWSASFSP